MTTINETNREKSSITINIDSELKRKFKLKCVEENSGITMTKVLINFIKRLIEDEVEM
ncbi:MAG: hypothetical protein ACFFDH_00175 [Promethearchaeota archaeon]